MFSFKDKTVDFLSRHFLYMMTVLALLAYAGIYLEGCFGLPIRSDGEGYYAYLPALFIYGDPSFAALADNRFGGEFPHWTHIFKHPDTGRYLNTYNIGVALMMLPFFIAAHVLTFLFQSPPGGFTWWRFNYPMDGYSFFYQHAAGLAGVFYFLCGVALLKKSLERYFSPGVVLGSLFAMLFGTSLFSYGVGETVMSHAYTFFLVSALLVLVPAWNSDPGSKTWAVLLGVVLGLLLLVRTLNVLYFLLFALFGIYSLRDLADRGLLFWRQRAALLLVGMTILLVFSPQLLMWKYSSGSFLVNSYREYFRFTEPHLLDVFFGLKKGLFVWFPILIFAFTGLSALRFCAREYFWPALVFLVLYSLTVSSYFVWWGGGGFGNRYFMDAWALMAFPLAAFYARCNTRGRGSVVAVLSCCFVAYTMFLMKLYYTREIPHEGLDARAFFDILWLRK